MSYKRALLKRRAGTTTRTAACRNRRAVSKIATTRTGRPDDRQDTARLRRIRLAERALGFAIETAQKYGAHLHVIAVARPPDLGTEIEVEPVIERELKHYESVLAGIADKAPAWRRVAREVVVGHRRSRCSATRRRTASTHHRRQPRALACSSGLLLGSIARQVVAHAPCNVTIVRA
jgi:nucleotide-binding universal stress UspA family protein